MSRSLLHNWEGSIEKNKNNTEELLKIAEDIYYTAYARGKASEEKTQGEWGETEVITDEDKCKEIRHVRVYYHIGCPNIGKYLRTTYSFCPNCGAKMRGKENG